MAKAISGHNLGTALTIALLAALLLLLTASVFVVWQATTTSDRSGTPAISADRDGGSSFAQDPYVDRYAELIARHNRGTLLCSS